VFDSQRYQSFSEEVGLERGLLSLVSTIEELFEGKKVEAPVCKTKTTAVGIHSADHATPIYLSNLALNSPTSGGRSVGIVCWRTKATELFSSDIQNLKRGMQWLHGDPVNFLFQSVSLFF
jgi:hypothetical protein